MFVPLGLASALTVLSTTAWAPTGVQFGGTGYMTKAANTPDGGAVFSWTDFNNNVLGNRITAAGDVMGPSGAAGNLIGVSLNRASNDAVVSDGAGGAYVLWRINRRSSQRGYDLYLSRVDGQMNSRPGWPIVGLPVDDSAMDFNYAQICGDGAGGVFISWNSTTQISAQNTSGPDTVRIQHILSSGAQLPGWPSRGMTAAISSGEAPIECVVADGTGGAYLVYELSPPYLQYVQHILSDGSVATGWPANGRRLKTFATTSEFCMDATSAVPDGAGGLYVGWDDDRERPVGAPADASYGDIFLQHIQPDGSNTPGWPQDGYPVHAGPGVQWNAQLCPDGFGGALVAWMQLDGAGLAWLTRVRADGNQAPGWPQGGTIACSPVVADNPQPASDGKGGAFVAFLGNGRLWAQHWRGDGTLAPGYAITGTLLVDLALSGQQEPSIVPSLPGSAIVAWQDQRNPGGVTLRAQRLIDDGIVPVGFSLRSTDADADHVRLWWWGAAAGQANYSVERSSDGTTWSSLGLAQITSEDQLSFEDRAITPGARYAYRLTDSFGKAVVALTWVDVPARAEFALAGARPDPAPRGQFSVAFSLPTQAAGTLELLDIAGRRVAWRDLGALGAGRHVISMPETASLAPGVHWLRLAQGAKQAVKRVVVVN